jgi:hypothetical protein
MLVSRRDTLAAASVLGVIAVAPAVAEAVDERPKEGDFLVAVSHEHRRPVAEGYYRSGHCVADGSCGKAHPQRFSD